MYRKFFSERRLCNLPSLAIFSIVLNKFLLISLSREQLYLSKNKQCSDPARGRRNNTVRLSTKTKLSETPFFLILLFLFLRFYFTSFFHSFVDGTSFSASLSADSFFVDASVDSLISYFPLLYFLFSLSYLLFSLFLIFPFFLIFHFHCFLIIQLFLIFFFFISYLPLLLYFSFSHSFLHLLFDLLLWCR